MCFPPQLVGSKEEQEEILNDLPVGFRFVPTNEELVCAYLVKKITRKTLPSPIIKEIGLQELYGCAPWDLPAMDLFRKHERYFFTPWNTRLHDGSRLLRKGRFGFWKPYEVQMPVYDSTGKELALKNVLHFYYTNSRETAKPTRWIMEEFLLKGSTRIAMRKMGILKDEWVLCRIRICGATSVF